MLADYVIWLNIIVVYVSELFKLDFSINDAYERTEVLLYLIILYIGTTVILTRTFMTLDATVTTTNMTHNTIESLDILYPYECGM